MPLYRELPSRTLNKKTEIVEDSYLLSRMTKSDRIDAPNPQEVVITCRTKKRRVNALLSEGIQINTQSNWEEMFGGGIMSLAGSAIGSVNNITQMVGARSIQQPWMNRKFWKNTSPFSFTLGLNFVARSNAKTEVFDPAITLVSFAYPRQSEGTFEQVKSWLKEKLKIGEGSILDEASKVVKLFVIPGPSIKYDGSNTSSDIYGDAVTVCVGNMIAMGGVYLENVDVNFSNSMDASGYPLSAQVKVKVTSMDVNSCKSDGDFLMTEFAQNQAALSGLLVQIDKTIKQATEDTVNIFKSWVGFFSKED